LKLQIGIDGKSYEVEVEITEDDTAPKPHYIPAQAAPTVLSAAPPAAGAGARKPAVDEGPVDEDKVCRSPIAGMVTRVNVQEGQQIQPNDLLLVLEAMKMELTLSAPIAGTIETVRHAVDDMVEEGAELITFAS